jgi:hypothetical protein
MKKRRWLLLAALAAGLAVVVLSRIPRGPAGFATPAECVEAYAEASKNSDVDRYLACLAEPLRSEARHIGPEKLAETLRREMAEVKGWAQQPAAEPGDGAATIEVDEIRPAGTRRLRFRLTRTGGGWLIAAVEPPRDVSTPVRYGTRVGAEP